MHIQAFFDDETATISYVVSDSATHHCAIIDAVHDFDLYSGQITTRSVDRIIEYIHKMNLQVKWILETHTHADHLSAASVLKEVFNAKTGIGENFKKLLSYWLPIFNTTIDTPTDRSQFDVLFADGDQFKIGQLNVKVIHTPGHTPDCISYYIDNDAIFVGDTIFMPYVGTARTDFPGGGADYLYHSIKKILALPDQTRIFTCHDYPPDCQPPAWESTVAEQKKMNVMINETISEQEFVAMRNKKDFNKSVPKLLLPSIQVNLRAGKLGSFESNKTQYIIIPINKLSSR